ncbi:rCG62011 [Rattus norvegicus]|uniref:RCG62011 n=1 Tax=Rattus norvegicus TaxID=10116 RepID=A6HB43_RAT|nr:rCG62011 [Rattus norvegicus]
MPPNYLKYVYSLYCNLKDIVLSQVGIILILTILCKVQAKHLAICKEIKEE